MTPGATFRSVEAMTAGRPVRAIAARKIVTMQDRYVGDIGDYLKLGILRALSPGYRIGIAWWLGNAINSRPGGFFIVAAFYLVIMIVIIAMRKKVIFPFLRNIITRKIYE